MFRTDDLPKEVLGSCKACSVSLQLAGKEETYLVCPALPMSAGNVFGNTLLLAGRPLWFLTRIDALSRHDPRGLSDVLHGFLGVTAGSTRKGNSPALHVTCIHYR
jgi:hypothetical protein